MIIDIPMSYFLLLIAGLAAIITYAIIPKVPVVALVSAAAITLAGAIVWHWLQFASDYRANTWMEQLRNYSSYVMLLVIFIASYGFYTFAWMNRGLTTTPAAEVIPRNVTEAATAILNAPAEVVSDTIETITRALSQPIVGENSRNAKNAKNAKNADKNAKNADKKADEIGVEEISSNSILSNFLL